jgi:hypothetical protein
MSDPTSASESPFTPSELVVLHGEKFAEEGGMLTAKEEALVSRIKVSAEKLAHAALAAAVLANEQAGVVRLEARKGSALFGLMKTDKLHVVAADQLPDWPDGSLEYSVAMFAHSGPTLQDLVQTVIGNKSHNPGQTICSIVKAGLAGRDLMDVAERKMLGLITVPHFVLRDDVRQAAMAESPARVQALLRATEQGRPQLWEQMIKEIRAAMVWMTDSND